MRAFPSTSARFQRERSAQNGRYDHASYYPPAADDNAPGSPGCDPRGWRHLYAISRATEGGAQGENGPGLACEYRVPLAGPPGARWHCQSRQLHHGPARRPHQEQSRDALRSSRPGRALRIRQRREKRHLLVAAGHYLPQRRARDPGRRQVYLRELPRSEGGRAQRQDRARGDRGRSHHPLRLQRALFGFPLDLRDRECERGGLGGAGQVLPAGGARRLQAEADRGRPLQAGAAGAGDEAGDGGL